MLNVKNWQLILFTLVGIIIVTLLILNMEVKKEVRDVVQEQYEKGNVSESAYKSALSDGKLSNLEVMKLRNK